MHYKLRLTCWLSATLTPPALKIFNCGVETAVARRDTRASHVGSDRPCSTTVASATHCCHRRCFWASERCRVLAAGGAEAEAEAEDADLVAEEAEAEAEDEARGGGPEEGEPAAAAAAAA